MMFVSIDMVNVVLDQSCIKLKYKSEAINHKKLNPLFSRLKFS